MSRVRVARARNTSSATASSADHMPVNLKPAEGLKPVPGVSLSCTAAGIRYRGRDDLVLIHLAPGSQVAGVFTRNAFCAAPVVVCREHLAGTAEARALLINAGNANAGTGQAGLDAARRSCALAADALDVDTEAVLPLSTGVIGQALPVEPFARALPILAGALDANSWDAVARAIMTTDTVPKGISRQCQIDGRTVTVTGIAKGAGMIRPDMATMLAFVATDAVVESGVLQALLNEVVAESFNAITVDGDTSTNDACIVAATGAAGHVPLTAESPALPVLRDALREVCVWLAQACVRDAEGATRFIRVEVGAAASVEEARQVAYTVAQSPLVKTAAFAGDPNWGRILAAVGRSGLEALDLSLVNLYLDDVCLIRGGEPDPGYSEARGAAVASKSEYCIQVVLGRGDSSATVWTCDYSYDYVKINAEYRS